MNSDSLQFLNGGGDMGARMRTLDWTATPLGPPAHWPQSLKTIVRVMLDSRFAMWMLWGEAGTFFCNDAYLPTVGRKRDWVLGARADRVWEEIWQDIGPRIEYVHESGLATYDEGLQLFLRRSGYDEETFHTFSYSPVYDNLDKVAGMLCVVVETTHAVIAERRLRILSDLASPTRNAPSVSAAGLRMIETLFAGRLDLPFAALYLVDADAASAQLVGSTLAPPATSLPASVGLGAAAPSGTMALAVRSGTEQLVDDLPSRGITIAGPWGEPVLRALVVPLHSAGRAAAFGVLVLGISTRRQLDERYHAFLGLVASQFESSLVDTRARVDAVERARTLADLDRAKNVFFSNVSHEFRTPLTLMLGPIDDLLARRSLPADVSESLVLVQRNGARLRKLVNSLLDFSRIEAGRVEGRYQATDLAAFTRDLASVFRAAVEQAGLRLMVRCEALPEPAYVDRDMWEKVVLNLLSNALKHTFDGEIEVVLATSGTQAVLQVRDTGVGIAAPSLPHIFERFHRVPDARARTAEGTGIGLALVHELVKLHGGTVSATSEEGRGSCFTVSIPMGVAHLPHEQVQAGDSTAPAPATASTDSASFVDAALRSNDVAAARSLIDPGDRPACAQSAERILVVDDNADMRLYLTRLLERYWHVTTAANGVDALQAIGESLPNLVVTDMMMPGLDGRGLIQHIRTHPKAHALPVIMLSAQAGDEARTAGLQQGADDYLVKPFSARELLARVELQLMRSRTQAAGAAAEGTLPWLESLAQTREGSSHDAGA